MSFKAPLGIKSGIFRRCLKAGIKFEFPEQGTEVRRVIPPIDSTNCLVRAILSHIPHRRLSKR
ncbi:hypothetical protein H6G96_38220 [Nostoc sp. FACHB-892]|uniref:hypothetical protein n=1 Tax=Nostoc sp. FACHB-892 TaxID=2692843 RepID=UPI0016832EDE|nr:hypothetical protein [Nostoc sp. FACHB-892]MBD2731946.1 hypothetical protein [Nostoc sp. FACHB-892]